MPIFIDDCYIEKEKKFILLVLYLPHYDKNDLSQLIKNIKSILREWKSSSKFNELAYSDFIQDPKSNTLVMLKNENIKNKVLTMITNWLSQQQDCQIFKIIGNNIKAKHHRRAYKIAISEFTYQNKLVHNQHVYFDKINIQWDFELKKLLKTLHNVKSDSQNTQIGFNFEDELAITDLTRLIASLK